MLFSELNQAEAQQRYIDKHYKLYDDPSDEDWWEEYIKSHDLSDANADDWAINWDKTREEFAKAHPGKVII